ncbi:hypothetical protein ANO11243_091000 [Dothideomycetidae sp. 11243]|nr:hypothetical protein ANO11243_091000 [fungal sp. No.11243]
MTRPAYVPPSKEGFIPFNIPSVGRQCFTRYQLYGELGNGPVMIGLHGGPAAGIFPEMSVFWPQDNIPVILYDQIGCGESTRLPEKHKDESFWQMSLFLSELDNLIDHLRLRDGPGFHLVGTSYGAMIAADYATTRPRGLRGLVLCSPFASRKLLDDGHRLRRKELPLGAQEALTRGDETGDSQSAEYRKALLAYHKNTMCRLDPWPAGWDELFDECYKNPVFQVIAGPGPTTLGLGSFRDWNVVPRLHRITATTLVINGEFDTAWERAVSPFFDLIPRVRWITYANASHGVMMETPAAEKLVGEFLKQIATI